MKLKINRVVKNWNHVDKIKINNEKFIENPVSFGRRFAKQQVEPELWKKAFSEFNLIPSYIEPMFENFLGNNFKDGASVHPHKDDAPIGFVHTRCNLLLKKPLVGGNPIIDGEEINLEENDLWLILSSLEEHGTTPIQGGERFIFSFGGLVPIKQIEGIIG
jgi:hypothetical protein